MNRALVMILLSLVGLPARAALSPQGGQDSGGGNVIDGKVLESYLVDPATLPGFARIAPQLDTLRANRDTRILVDGSLRKNWYFVPGPLSALSAEQIGATVATEQAARQDLRAIWIDRTLFLKLSEDQQAALLLHEMIMGMRLFKLDSPYFQCKVIFWDSLPNACDEYSRQARGRPLDLTAHDYDAIRLIVRTLLDRPDLPTKDLLRLFNDGGFAFNDFTFRLPLRTPRLADLLQAFSTATLSGQWPAYAYEEKPAVTARRLPGQEAKQTFSPTGRCEFRLKQGNGGQGFTLTVKSTHRGPYRIHAKELTEANFQRGGILFYLDEKGQPAPELGGQATVGTKVTWIQIRLDRVGFERDGQYYTQAQLKAVRILKGVRVDAMGNDAIFAEKSLVCSTEADFSGLE